MLRRTTCRASVLVLVLLAACAKKAAPPQLPPPQVTVVEVEARSIPATFTFVAQAQASQTVEVRSLVSGTLLQRYFTEGTDIAKGAALYLIDPAPYNATYQSALSQVATAQARLEQTQRDLGRTKALFEGGAVSQRQLDDAQTAYEQAVASMTGAKAAVDKAKVDLDRTRIIAEIPGRIGLTQLQAGAQVSGPTVLLTTIDQIDPIFVNIPISDNERLRWEDNIRTGRIILPKNKKLKVQLTLSDSSRYPFEGEINFTELSVDRQTGTMQVRAQFRNPDRRLLPNQFVRATIGGATRNGALLVPQRAVQQGLSGPYVYVVGVGDTVTARTITATNWIGGLWLIQEGLAPGDRVVVDGVQKVVAGRPVRPSLVDAAADSAPAPAPPETAGGA